MKRNSLLYPLVTAALVLVMLVTSLPYRVLAESPEDNVPSATVTDVDTTGDPADDIPPAPVIDDTATIDETTPNPVFLSNPSALDTTAISTTLSVELTGYTDSPKVSVLFEYGEDTTYPNISALQQIASNGTYSTGITGLKPNMEYHFRARAVSSGGDICSDDSVFTTQGSHTSTGNKSDESSTPTINPDDQVISKTTIEASPEADTQIKSADEKISVSIPKGALAEIAQIELSQLAVGGSTGMKMLNLFELKASSISSGKGITKFDKNLQITIKHAPEEVAGIDVDSLCLYYLDEKTGQWLPLTDSKYDTNECTLTATTNHFTNFGEMANPLQVGPGRVMASEVDLHSGAATYSYPLELPPGPGGFQPKLQLTYNSGSADEMKNKQDVGSWVGIGWSLDVGRINYDLTTKQYFLDLDGASYELLSSDDTNYSTNPEQYYKITRSGNTWEMYNKDGKYYRFGGTSDSQQYLYVPGRTYYRWDLSLFKDTNGNQATISYSQDIRGTAPYDFVRSAYPTTLTYGNVQVSFTTAYDESTNDGTLRYDNPKSGSNPAPMIMENRRLSLIEVKVNNVLIRKYTFSYNTTNRVYSSDYGGIYYSGQLTLSSITQVGADGSSQLPGISFGYQQLQTYRQGGESSYTGNPGNPASFSWSHLVSVNSGYGGSISFSYTQMPNIFPVNRWTREVVTGKTINSGIGSNQDYTYTYTGYPSYLGWGWEQEYRGFNQVRETDAVGNYINHFFYTTGVINNNDAEKLTGKEYKTQWFDSGGALLHEKNYDWSAVSVGQTYDCSFVWNSSTIDNAKFLVPMGMSIDSQGYVYVADTYNSLIQKLDSNGNIFTLGSFGTGNGQFNYPYGVAVDSQGCIYVVDTYNHRIQKFDSNGNFILEWGSFGTDNGQFSFPKGIAINSQGYVYVADTLNHRIQKFDSSGNFVLKWGSYGYNDGQFSFPQGISIDSQGYVYVADTSNHRIQKFDSSGNFILKWGSSGSGDGYFVYPAGISIDSQGYVYVADTGNNRVQKFDSSGNFILKWGSSGTDNGQFNGLSGIVIDSQGYVYVADTGNARIEKFDSSCNFICIWGGYGNAQFTHPVGIAINSQGYTYMTDIIDNRIEKFDSNGHFIQQWGSSGTGNGQFSAPCGIAINSQGYVYVADSANHRIQKFDSNGDFILKWGSWGTGNGQFYNPYGIAIDSQGYVYVADTFNSRIQKFDSNGNFVLQWGSSGNGNGQFNNPYGIAIDSQGYVYVADTFNSRIQKFDSSGNFILKWGSSGYNDGQFCYPWAIAIDSQGYVYVADTSNARIQKFDSDGNFILKWGIPGTIPVRLSIDSQGYIYVVDTNNCRIQGFTINWFIQLNQIDDTMGAKTSRTRYEYDGYGNVATEYQDGDLDTNADDSTIWTVYYPNTTANILDKPARERTYAGIVTADNGGSSLKQETDYYYDGNNTSLSTPPTVGNLTRQQQYTDSSNSVSSYYTYDTYGNKLTDQDPNGNTTTWTYETTNTYPATKTYPITGLSESYTYDPGTTNLLSQTDVNSQTTSYEYDTFKRQIKVIKPGDSSGSPSIQYQYNNWGTINQQNIETITKIDGSNSLWQAEYFDGLGRVVQTQSQSETSGHTIVASTAVYNDCGQVSKQYVSQDIASNLTAYLTPDTGWKYTTYTYDGLGRVTNQVNADGTSVGNDYSTAWQITTTDALGHQDDYFYDAFQRLIQVNESVNNYTFDKQLGTPCINDGNFDYPYDIAVDSSGNVYVVDTYNQRVQKFDASGNFVTRWGTYGNGNGQFKTPWGIAVDSQGYVYVADTGNSRIQKFDSSGNFIAKFGSSGSSNGKFSSPHGIVVDSQGNIYVVDTSNYRIQKFNSSFSYMTKWGSSGSGDGQFASPKGIALDSSGNVYVADTSNARIQKFDSSGTFIAKWGTSGSGNGQFSSPRDVDIDSQGYIYVADSSNNRIQKFDSSGTYVTKWGAYGNGNLQFKTPYGLAVYTSGGNTFVYIADSYNNRIQKTSSTGSFLTKWGAAIADGQLDTPYSVTTDSSGNVYIVDYYNHQIQVFDSSGDFLRKWGSYGSGNGQFKYPRDIAVDSQGYVYVTDDSNNRVQKFDSSGNFITKWGSSGTGDGQFGSPYGIATDSSNNIYVVDTDNNRIQKFDSSGNFIAKWGSTGTGDGQFTSPMGIAINSSDEVYVVDTSNRRVEEFDASGNFLAKWGSYGSGDGQFSGPRGIDIDTAGNVYVADSSNNRFQKFQSNGTFILKYGSFGTGSSYFSTPYGIAVGSSGNIYIADTNNHRIQKFVWTADTATAYTYDTLGNLTQVIDTKGNTTTMTYDWLSRKTGMTDPDMGTWSYGYDVNGNLTSQTDAKTQTITMVYDALNRLTNKNYPTGSGMTNITYSYDSTTGSNYGMGLRTGMTDAAGTTSYKYDTRGREIEEKRTLDSTDYTTSYTYDGADRAVTITYPTGETVTNTYNGRGLPYTLSGSTAGNLVTSTTYNGLGLTTQINIGNGLKTTWGYYGTGGTNDTTGGYYGRLWEIKTLPQAGGTALQDVKYTWDADGNLLTRQDVLASETETFTYDVLDSLISVSGPYMESFAYDMIGNLLSKNGSLYTYDTKPQAVTKVGSTTYAYDSNGNMTTRGSQTITWDVENRPVTITGGASFVYDGDGTRVKQTEGGVTILYINKYYEKNLTTGEVTTNYYLGNRLVATRKGTTLNYIHQDSLTSTSVTTNSGGTLVSTIKYFSFGGCLKSTGTLPTDKLFTGQRLDSTGLYYYGARYYDAEIGRFISPDNVGQQIRDPQTFNRYAYCYNNPLKYVDPTGHWPNWNSIFKAVVVTVFIVAVVAVVIVAAPVAVPALACGGTLLLGMTAGEATVVCAGAGIGVGLASMASDSEQEQKANHQAGGGDTAPPGNPNDNNNFKSKKLLDEHYGKHGKEFGNISEDEYLQGARKLVNSTDDDILTTKRINGDTIYYKESTNEFAVKDSEGNINTYFKPTNGIDYFYEQH